MNNPIVLIGFKSVGKTTIGQRLAHKLNLKWYDTDGVLEQEHGCSIKTLFARLGANEFREKEIHVLQELLQLHDVVISTGGGIIEHAEFEKIVSNVSCFKIHLHMPFDEILQRIQEKPGFLGDDDLESIYYRRLEIYQKVADMSIDVSSQQDNYGK